MPELSLQDLGELFFTVALVLGSAITFGLGFIGGVIR